MQHTPRPSTSQSQMLCPWMKGVHGSKAVLAHSGPARKKSFDLQGDPDTLPPFAATSISPKIEPRVATGGPNRRHGMPLRQRELCWLEMAGTIS